jgi:hypothetical protein
MAEPDNKAGCFSESHRIAAVVAATIGLASAASNLLTWRETGIKWPAAAIALSFLIFSLTSLFWPSLKGGFKEARSLTLLPSLFRLGASDFKFKLARTFLRTLTAKEDGALGADGVAVAGGDCAPVETVAALADAFIECARANSFTPENVAEMMSAVRPRSASTKQVKNAINGGKILESLREPARNELVEEMVKDFSEGGIMLQKLHGSGSAHFELFFEIFNFMVDQNKTPRLKTAICSDIIGRFSGLGVESVVCIHRGHTNPRLYGFCEEIVKSVHCNKWESYPLQHGKRNDEWSESFRGVCEDKKVLLVEPLLIDNAIDEAVDCIINSRGEVAGIVVLFSVEGVDPKRLTRFAELMTALSEDAFAGEIHLCLN